ncbi:hypothetical protein HHL19_35835 [Streptomyces sp. R302]|uniref:hypothetical protein n=1 Tax=unclassified Streptomyces TaxID=2593676 RepID=UPI00145F9F00|nr:MULTISPECIES: hypothetical protein [unclassified Streptomyces]NML55088.1 hypothetical protein [Streptomyces sp. R301]NML83882.1 hypothetical protein [Streptomyces sp. R302]
MSTTTPAAPQLLPEHTRVLRTSDGRFGTVTAHGAEGNVITWDGAPRPASVQYTRDELVEHAYRVFLPVQHCMCCGDLVDAGDTQEGYTTCCNDRACTCAAVDGAYECGTEQPAEAQAEQRAQELNRAAYLDGNSNTPALRVGGLAVHVYRSAERDQFIVSVHPDTGDIPDDLLSPTGNVPLQITVGDAVVYDAR